MESSTIKNPETQQPQNEDMNDRDMLTDALSTEKYLCGSYTIAMNEASNDSVYEMISDFFDDTSRQQRKFYDLLFQHGWYSITPAQESEIKKAQQNFSDLKQQLQ